MASYPNAPKFGSFKPRPRADFPNSATPASRRSYADEPLHNYREREPYYQQAPLPIRSHDSDRWPSRDRGQDPSRSHRRRSRSPARREDYGLSMTDTRGDPKNVEFGSMNRSEVPLYYRFGAGYVVGAPTNFRIDRDLSDDKNVVFRITDAPFNPRSGNEVPSVKHVKTSQIDDDADFALNKESEPVESEFVELQPRKAEAEPDEDDKFYIPAR